RLILLVCLLLPLVPPRLVEVDIATGPDVRAALTETSRPAAAARRSSPLMVMTWLVAGGMLARTLWLAVGLVRLRSLRTDGVIATLSGDLAIMHGTLAPLAEIRWHDRISQPVT